VFWNTDGRFETAEAMEACVAKVIVGRLTLGVSMLR
jgi:hypothetical protein